MSVKDSVLSALMKSRGSFVSGMELSEDLGVSRTTIWKAIEALRENGLLIEAVTNKGYMLIEKNTPITREALQAALPARYKNNRIHICDTVNSTNTYAKQLALEGSPHGTIVIAHNQTEGKGRLGREFYSPASGIYLSIVIKPTFDFSKSGLVTTAAAVAVADAIESVCGSEALIKWVNDVYVSGRKVCGILSEGMTDFETGQIETIIIGIGINTTVDNFPEKLLSVAGAVEGEYSSAALAAEVITRILDFIENLEGRSFMEPYRKKSLVIGKNITIYEGIYKNDPSEVPSRSALALDIDDDGGLMVLYSDGTKETLTSGEISIRI